MGVVVVGGGTGKNSDVSREEVKGGSPFLFLFPPTPYLSPPLLLYQCVRVKLGKWTKD